MGTYKRMSKREKVIRAKAKRELQKEGILPPNKPKLNRQKYIKEAEAAWDCRGCLEIAARKGASNESEG